MTLSEWAMLDRDEMIFESLTMVGEMVYITVLLLLVYSIIKRIR